MKRRQRGRRGEVLVETQRRARVFVVFAFADFPASLFGTKLRLGTKPTRLPRVLHAKLAETQVLHRVPRGAGQSGAHDFVKRVELVLLRERRDDVRDRRFCRVVPLFRVPGW